MAKSRANQKLHFHLLDFSEVTSAYFELVLVLDVIEQLQDFFCFPRALKNKGRHKIFHIPLDLSVQTLLRKGALLKRREMYGHLHYFTRETALETLRETGYEIVDCSYTPRVNNLGGDTTQRLLKLPRALFFAIHKGTAVRVLRGYSLPILAR